MSLVWFAVGLFVGILFGSLVTDRHYKEVTAQRLAIFSREVMLEFGKAFREAEEAKSRIKNSQLN